MEYLINGIRYTISENSFDPLFSFINEFDEQGESWPTPLDALQEAMEWESGRRQRYAESGATLTAAYWEHQDDKINDKKEMENE